MNEPPFAGSSPAAVRPEPHSLDVHRTENGLSIVSVRVSHEPHVVPERQKGISFSGGNAMLSSVRYAGMTSALVVAVTLTGAGTSSADQKISAKLKNRLPVDVSVQFEGTNALTGPYEFKAGADRSLGSIPDQTTIRWTAVPTNIDKSPFKKCSGTHTVGSGSKDTVVLNADNCEKKPVSSSSTQASPTIDITFDIQSKYGAMLVTEDKKAPIPGRETRDLSPKGKATYHVYKDKDGSINFQVNVRCSPAGMDYSGGDQTTYTKPVSETIVIKDVTDDYKGICKLSMKQ